MKQLGPWLALCIVFASACGSDTENDPFGGDGGPGAGDLLGGAAGGGAPGAGSPGGGAPGAGAPGAGDGGVGVVLVPPDDAACADLQATVRDFTASHPDFEKFGGDDVQPGIVEVNLGADDKPVYAAPGPTADTSGPDAFDQWYRDVSGVNEAFPLAIALTQQQPGLFVFDSAAFFPIDGRGAGNEGRAHNYHFTTEIHTRFAYKGGEVFTFRGDDDLWTFVNGKLAIDLGGLHTPKSQTINFDQRAAELGLEIGKTYAMDIFHAERHTVDSNFRIETSIACFSPPVLF